APRRQRNRLVHQRCSRSPLGRRRARIVEDSSRCCIRSSQNPGPYYSLNLPPHPMPMPVSPPAPDEYASFQASYVSLVRDEDPFDLLRGQPVVLRQATLTLSDSDALHRYAPGKWSVKEVLGHLSDTERVLSYRLMRI